MTNELFPIRTELTVLPADKPISSGLHKVIFSRNRVRRKDRIGFTVRETIGIAVFNPRGLRALTKTIAIKEEKKCQDVDIPAEISSSILKSVWTAVITFTNRMLNMRKIFVKKLPR